MNFLFLSSTLAWRPFLDPLPLHDVWFWFLIPLSFGIAVVYKAVRLKALERYWMNVVFMTIQIVLGMVALALVSYLFIGVYVPLVANKMAGG